MSLIYYTNAMQTTNKYDAQFMRCGEAGIMFGLDGVKPNRDYTIW